MPGDRGFGRERVDAAGPGERRGPGDVGRAGHAKAGGLVNRRLVLDEGGATPGERAGDVGEGHRGDGLSRAELGVLDRDLDRTVGTGEGVGEGCGGGRTASRPVTEENRVVAVGQRDNLVLAPDEFASGRVVVDAELHVHHSGLRRAGSVEQPALVRQLRRDLCKGQRRKESDENEAFHDVSPKFVEGFQKDISLPT